jgi:hypothetical protein
MTKELDDYSGYTQKEDRKAGLPIQIVKEVDFWDEANGYLHDDL